MKQFTFKKVPKSKGLASIAETGNDIHDIKLNGHVVGQLFCHDFDDVYKITFMVMKNDVITDDNPNCKWKWITLKYRPLSEKDGKSYIRAFYKEIQTKYNLHSIE